MNREYNIGLDIGTTSVGWAVVDSQTNKLIRKGNKNLWGVRLFEEANSAAGRRAYRGSRRRYNRRRYRIKLLQDIFKDEINSIDKDFFIKLKESFFVNQDNLNKTIKLTKADRHDISDYYKKYHTIYHLRNDLINNPEKKDIRLVYLALHHIIKYRGNFLYNSDNLNINNLNVKAKLEEIFNEIINDCPELEFSEDYLSIIDYDKIEQSLLYDTKNDKKVVLNETLSGLLNKNSIAELIKLLNGNQCDIAKLFNIELDEKISISFTDTNYDEKIANLSVIENRIDVFELLKELYDIIYLKKLFGKSESTTLSGKMVEKYDKHRDDLRLLKDIFDVDRKAYRAVFRSNKSNTCLYDKYIHNDSNTTYNDFTKSILQLISKSSLILDNTSLKDKIELLNKEIDSGEFLPKITEVDNGRFPYQLNKKELEIIIENQGKYYPFLLDEVKGKNKLITLLEFRIPYYVGPLVSSDASKFAWMKRKTNDKITPYNFDDVVDKDSSAIDFIERMLGHCTYLLDEPAMPNNSIICNEFKVLNELKQIRINDKDKLDIKLIHKIIDEFFKKSNKLTNKEFVNYLISTGEFEMYGRDFKVTGYSADGKFANNMKSYIDFFGENGFFKNTNYTLDDAETIIRWITIFEDKDILMRKINDTYPLLHERVKEISNKKYKGWSNLSKRLLTEKYYVDKKTGIKKSILDLMYETNENFMQIINNSEYNFDSMISSINNIDTNNKIDYSLIDNLVTSPANKRGIWQSILVMDEITKYMGYGPKYISVEMARGDEKKKRTDDRKKYLLNLYTKCHEQIEDYNKLKRELDSYEKIDSQRLFLYFIQEGKSLYSRTPLDIDHLGDYEIDHIIPRSIIKDDSIDNKALVLKKENQLKAASLVLPEEFRKKYMVDWWNKLKDSNLMSSKKFYRLIRKEYSEKDIEGFINRQLVETRQITKHVANIFQNLYKKSKVIYLPANLSHNYREKFEMFKYRDLNDYHHAHDAYLAAVLAEYKMHLKTNINLDLLKDISAKLYSAKKYDELKYGYVINSISNEFVKFNNETGEIKFDADEFNNTVCNTLYQNDILISKKTEIRTGEFYNQTKNSKGQKGVPLKKGWDTKLYGSYTSLNPSYAVLVKYKAKGKEKQRIIGIPYYYDSASYNEKIDYITDLLKADKDSVELLSKRIPFYTVFNWNDQICSLVGATDKVEVCNALQFKLNKNEQQYYKYTLLRLLNDTNKIEDNEYNYKLDEFINLIISKIEKDYQLYANLVPELKENLTEQFLANSTIEIKEKVCKELLNLLKFNSTCANLKAINDDLSSSFGRKKSRIIENGTIINKSVTGIWENKNEF